MPTNGDTWQVMRLSRNRYWGHPETIALIRRLSVNAHKDAGWPGILVGDIGQPRGGPALSGHASHQLGLDADIWLTPMPDHLLSREEREDMSAVMMVREDRLDIDPKAWTPQHWMVIRDAAKEPTVQRIFVNAAIKKALCREADGRPQLAGKGPARGSATTIISTSACAARPAPPTARASPTSPAATAASLPTSLTGSRIRSCIPSRAAQGAAEAETGDHAGADAAGLQSGAECTGREIAVARAFMNTSDIRKIDLLLGPSLRCLKPPSWLR